MARPCVVCQHADREEIDALIVSGMIRGVSQKYRVSSSALARHRINHVGPAVLAASVAREALSQEMIVDKLQALQTQAETLLARANAAGDLQAAGRLIDQAHKILVSLGKTLSMFATATTVNDNRRLTINSPTLTEAQWRALGEWAEQQTALSSGRD